MLVNTDASSYGGIGVTLRDTAGELLAVYSYQVWGSTQSDINNLECHALLCGLQLVIAPCTVYTDSKHAVRWYTNPSTVKSTPYTQHLLAVRDLTYIHRDTVVSHVHRSDDYQRYADFAAKLRGSHTWDTPSKLREFHDLYSAYQLSPTDPASRKQTRMWLSDPTQAPLP
jgi:ribonuclease HI